MNTFFTPTLDRVQAKLPPVASQIFRLNRSIAGATYSVVATMTSQIFGAAADVSKRGQTGVDTVTGQARAASKKTMSTAANGIKQVRGQAGAQTSSTVGMVKDRAEKIATDAADAADGAQKGALGTLTKSELYDRAQELDIEGRSTMSKDELVEALRNA